MAEVNIKINGQEYTAEPGMTILEAARAWGVYIPSLCHDDRVLPYGACGVCVVEVIGMRRPVRACSAYINEGMEILTETERVVKNRRALLSLMMCDHKGDCRPPCQTACPANTDCQGYAAHAAAGEYKKAAELIRESIPLPSSIGRVCPRPCEEKCNRQLVEEPLNIAAIKQFAGDKTMGDMSVIPEAPPDTKKKIAVTGGGPGGLSAAYFLRLKGHGVTVYDAMPQMGGMLRYGIPEYRLPKAVLDAEINIIEKMGVTLINNTRVGESVTLDKLRGENDAVIIASGAWKSMALGCPGEDTAGVTGGIEYLREAAFGRNILPQNARVAVVGGGNTAMDACRAAVRQGAAEVYVIYRRSREEMPALDIEIEEAIEEGVVFKYLTNPIEIKGGDKVIGIRLQKMRLGEPDVSGRRSPAPIPGEEEYLDIDAVIIAIGQYPDVTGFEGVALTKKGTLAADEHTFKTNLPGVFAIGDCTNKGADIAVSAIGEAKYAAEAIDAYLNGSEYTPKRFTEMPFSRTQPTRADYADRDVIKRTEMSCLSPAERRGNFKEVTLGFSEDEVKTEAGRCLKCGCAAYDECELVALAKRYDPVVDNTLNIIHRHTVPNDHPDIDRNPDKCILCGLCVRVCEEVEHISALGRAGRGVRTTISAAFDASLKDSPCNACGKCIEACPTGALLSRAR